MAIKNVKLKIQIELEQVEGGYVVNLYCYNKGEEYPVAERYLVAATKNDAIETAVETTERWALDRLA